MILNKIQLENFGNYRGDQTIVLETSDRRRPVTLILGLNGAGKTTLLEGIQLAFYGKRSSFVQSKGLSFEQYLRNKVHSGHSQCSSSAVSLTFSTFSMGEETTYKVTRRWHLARTKVNFETSVDTNDEFDPLLTESFDEFIESILPRGIAGLFFFDGEQIADLADTDKSAQILQTAINSLLGLDLVDRLGKDLEVLRRRSLKKELPADVSGDVDTVERRLSSTYSNIRNSELKAASLNSSLASLTRHNQELTDKFRLQGGDLFERSDELSAAHTRAKEARDEALEELRSYAGTSAPILLVLPLLRDLEESLRTSHKVLLQEEVVTELEGRDNWLISELGGLLNKEDIRILENLLVTERLGRRSQEDDRRKLLITLEEFSVIKSHLDVDRLILRGLLEDRVKAEKDLELAEANIAAIPDEDSLTRLKEDLRLSSEKIIATRSKLEEEKSNLVSLRSVAKKLEDSLEKLLQIRMERILADTENARVIGYIEKTKVTLKKLKAAESQRHIRRITDLVEDSLNQLLRKKNLVGAIEIDPEHFDLSLKGKNGQKIEPDDLSAGERQLLAISLLWGLARSSGGSLPVVIDTPLGRLDSTHRQLLVERYFPHASHQVILLSTDTEISGDSLEQLRDHIGHSYALVFDNEINASRVEELNIGGSLA